MFGVFLFKLDLNTVTVLSLFTTTQFDESVFLHRVLFIKKSYFPGFVSVGTVSLNIDCGIVSPLQKVPELIFLGLNQFETEPVISVVTFLQVFSVII